jgi:hypothetical protein
MRSILPVARLSIIVPFTGEQHSFERTLVSVLEHRPPRCEVIVAHDGSYDDPYVLGDEVRFVEDATIRSPLSALAAAAPLARAPIVHFVHEGVAVTDGWVQEPLALLEGDATTAVGSVVYRSDQPERILTAGMDTDVADLCRSVGHGRLSTTREDLQSIQFPALVACFLRRETLLTLIDYGFSHHLLVTQLHWCFLMQVLGQQVRVATRSHVSANPSVAWPTIDRSMAAELQAVRSAHIDEAFGLVQFISAVAKRPWSLSIANGRRGCNARNIAPWAAHREALIESMELQANRRRAA